MCKNCAIVIGVTAVVLLGAAMWMYQSKYSHENQFIDGGDDDTLETPEDRIAEELARRQKEKEESKLKPSASAYMSMSEPVPTAQPYGCGSFMKDCIPGEVGGCEQYKQSCASADNSVRMTMARPGECDQFRRQCAMGEYASCDLYNRACLHENN